MASNIKKAGSVIRKSFRSRRYALLDLKENNNIDMSPNKDDIKLNQTRRMRRDDSKTSTSGNDSHNDNELNEDTKSSNPKGLRRSSVTQSMREAVGTIRQKLRMSTRRSRVNVTPSKVGKRRHSLGAGDVKMSSPFKIDTPRSNKIHGKSCLSMETPTRLRREVEALTANMQALSALTPNTLHARSTARKTTPLTNGSLKTPRSSRRRITTDIY
ncbi:hypothetical protein BgiBS90_035491 [Biomphalaria glabrata]|uniref:Uncharacterized protein n=1 Tax=Biomphalaria glabrata TaxID=6526 RepID=A0A2C9LM10_BIOGL|nr:hypothetical protein BgiBS90_035491 [Biomphalaria glabrata]